MTLKPMGFLPGARMRLRCAECVRTRIDWGTAPLRRFGKHAKALRINASDAAMHAGRWGERNFPQAGGYRPRRARKPRRDAPIDVSPERTRAQPTFAVTCDDAMRVNERAVATTAARETLALTDPQMGMDP